MAEEAHLANAPISEAILDIRVRVPEDFELSSLLSLQAQVSDRYPLKRDRHQFTSRLEMAQGRPPRSDATEAIDGYLFYSSDEKQVFQARKDGFTFNRLKPYENWQQFRDEANRLWTLYASASSAQPLRVGLRYINKMDIPMPVHDFNEYLTAAPIVPEGLPQSLNSFLTRVVMSEYKLEATAMITQVFEQIVDPRYMPLMLDIDVFQQRESMDEEHIWATFERLREFKNAIFFASITEKTKELFA